MDTIFDLDKEFDPALSKEYTEEALERLLSESEVKTTRKNCKKISPFTMGKRLSPGDAKGRFERYQFLYYMALKQRECKEKGYSVYDCIKNPSQRYVDLYSKMIFDIQRKVSVLIRLSTEESRSGGLDGKVDAQPYEKQGRYDESIHAVLYLVDSVMLNLLESFKGTDFNVISSQAELFLQELKELSKKNHLGIKMENYWDELYLHLNFAKCIYWEFDLRDSYLSVYETMSNYSESIGNGIKKEYFGMISEIGCGNLLDGNCSLFLEKGTDDTSCGRIVEKDIYIYPGEISAANMGSYLSALKNYVESHVDEIAKRVFVIETATKKYKKRILSHFRYVKGYIESKCFRNNLVLYLSKAELIAVFQVSFLISDQVRLAKKKESSAKAQSIDGKLKREKNSLSSSISNPEGKEPRYFTQFGVWVQCHWLLNAYGKDFIQLYQKMMYEVFKTLCAKCITKGTGNSSPTAIKVAPSMEITQFRAEEILIKAVEILIPDEFGQEQISEIVRELKARGFVFKKNALEDMGFLSEFGKYCMLLGRENIITVIQHALNASNQGGLRKIPLNEAAEDLFHQHILLLSVKYDADLNIYDFQSFNIHEVNMTSDLLIDLLSSLDNLQSFFFK